MLQKSTRIPLALIGVATLGLGLALFLTKEKSQDSQPQTQTKSENQQTKPIPDEETIEAKISTSEWKTYRNEGYGFELKFPPTLWPKLKIKKDSSENIIVIKFGFPTDDPTWYSEWDDGHAYLFGIVVFTKDQYEKYFLPDGGKPILLDENKSFMFTKYNADDVPRDLDEQWLQRENIFSTFQPFRK